MNEYHQCQMHRLYDLGFRFDIHHDRFEDNPIRNPGRDKYDRKEQALVKALTCVRITVPDDFPVAPGTSWPGYAACSVSDDFCKKTGLALAWRRAIRSLSQGVLREAGMSDVLDVSSEVNS